MNVYETILFSLAILAILEVAFVRYLKKGSVIPNALFWLLVVFLIFFAGLRTMGPDYGAYKTTFLAYNDGSPSTAWLRKNIEPAYALLNILLSGFPFWVLLLLVASLGVVTKALFISRYSPYKIASLVLYFTAYYMIKEMGQIRHGISLGFAMLSYSYLFQHKKKMFLVFSLISVAFHWSAICLFPLFFLYNINRSNSFYLGSIFLILPLLFIDLKTILFKSMSFLPSQLAFKVSIYAQSGQFSKSVGFNSTVILMLITFLTLVLSRKKIKRRFASIDIVTNIYFLGIIYYIVFSSISEFALRTASFFRILDLIIYPMFLLLVPEIALLLVILLSLNSYLTLSKTSADKLVNKAFFPYKSIINN